MRTLILAAIMAALMAATASADTVNVQTLAPPFEASNSTVTKTPDGVHFGTYADGGALGGSLTFHGFDGHTLGQLEDFSYTFTYRQAGTTTGAAPYARVFLDDGDGGIDDVLLDPSFCATTTPDQAVDLTYQLVGNSVRWDDDGCDGVPPDNQPYATAIAGHENEPIIGLLVSQGFSTGTDVSALLRQITVNGTTYCFTCPPDAPPAGSTSSITVIQPQTIIQSPATPTKPVVCQGNTKRVIHAPTRRGEKFLGVAATLRGKHLAVSGRAVTVNLTGQPEANYNVRLISRYRTAHGHVRHVKTTRNLSVVCA
jgi:hypothetical protein